MKFADFIQKVSNGSKWKIDLVNKTVKVDGKDTEIEPAEKKSLNKTELINILDRLYKSYKYSYPSERSVVKNGYFKALTADEMTDEQIAMGLDRNVCRACLEGFVLIMANENNLSKLFTTDNQWFWKGNDGLVIMKGWC